MKKSVNVDLGVVSAYGEALSAGFVGTREEFAAMLANLRTVHEECVTADSHATDAASRAESSADTVETLAEEVEQNKDAAAQSATDAAQSAQEAAETLAELVTDETLTLSGKPADAKATGDAVTELKNELIDLIDSHVKDIDITSKFERGTYYTNYEIGTIIDVSARSSTTADWVSFYFPCEKGDKFSVIGLGGNMSRLWCVTDTNFALIKKSENAAGSTTEPTIISIDEDGYIIINCTTSENHSVAYHEFISVLDAVDEVNSISNEVFEVLEWNPTYWVQGGLSVDGTESTSTTRIRSNYIRVVSGDVVSIKSGYKYNLAEYSTNDQSSFLVYKGMGVDNYTVQNDGFIRVGVGNSADDAISINTSLDILTVKGKHSLKDTVIDELWLRSPFKRQVNYGDRVSGWYKGQQHSYSVSQLSVGYETFINAWTELTSPYSGYVTKTDLGATSYNPDGTYRHAYLFDFNPVNLNKSIPKIIIVAGHHGFEKGNAFGLYYLCKDILENYDKSDVLAYLRTHVRIMVIPFLNAFGFDTNNYYNQNHVNINRNYDSDWVHSEPGNEGSGDAPFDQPESTIVKNLIESNLDTFLYIDSHSNGSGIVSDYPTVNWLSFYKEGNPFYDRMLDFARSQIAYNTTMFAKEFGVNPPTGVSIGKYSSEMGHGLSKSWVTEQGVLGMTLEGFNGFPDESERWSENCIRANAEIIGNWIIRVINGYRGLN
jgi:hypothetical protein